MTSPSPTQAPKRFLDAPFVLALGVAGLGVAGRVAWSAREGSAVSLVPPLLVGAIVAFGIARVWRDLRGATQLDRVLATFDGREASCDATLVRDANYLVDRAASGLPSICILVGLLGTFAGLFEALVGARALLGTAADAAALRSIVGAPLSGLTRAFGSSAAGIVGSIVLGAAEGRFQSLADALAVRVESIEEALRVEALGARLASVLEKSRSDSRAEAAREAAMLGLLERVARAVEAQAREGNGAGQSVEALEGIRAQVVAILPGIAAAIDSGAARRAASNAALLEAVVASGEATMALVRDAHSASAEGRQEALLNAQEAMRALSEGAIAALREGHHGLALATQAGQRAADDATAQIVASTLAEGRRLTAESIAAHAAFVEAARDGLTAAVREAMATVDNGGAALDGAARELRGALVAFQASALERATADGTHLRDALELQARHLERGLERVAAAAERTDAAASLLKGGATTAIVAVLGEALEAWERRDAERYAREELARAERAVDDDARRSEWSGAEKLVVHGAMDLIAERLHEVALVQSTAASTVRDAQRVFAELEAGRSEASRVDEARRASSEAAFASALERGTAALATAFTAGSAAMLESARSEFERLASGLHAHAAMLADDAQRTRDDARGSLGELDRNVGALAAHAADVARGVDTLAEVLRGLPTDGVPARAADELAARVPASGDEDRAAFVGCLEEARRWFDASQALQQKLLDDLAGVRGDGGRA